MDPNNLNAVTLQSCKDIARQDSQTILSSRASAATKTAVLLMTTYKRIEYRAQFLSLNLIQLHQLDKIIFRFHLRVISNMNGFPYALLYGDSKYGGVGLQRLSDTITIDKLRNLYACLQSNHFTASVSNGLISRAARLQYGLTRPDQYLRLEPVKGATYYMNSILEWGKAIDCYLCRHVNRPAACTLDSTLEEIVTTPLTAKEVQTLHLHNTLTIGEIILDDTTNKKWNISQKLRWIRTKMPDQPPSDKRMLLRPGQYWRAQTTHPQLRSGSVCKIFYVTYDQLITFRHWTTTTYNTTSKYR